MTRKITAEEMGKLNLIKDLRVVLKDFEPLVKDPRHLWNGRELANFQLRPREAWANWLVCVVLRHVHGRDITFMEDVEGDGFIVDRELGAFFPTEHVSALEIPLGRTLPSGEQRIIDAIDKKIARGPEYAQDKILIVFFDGTGLFHRNRIRESVYRRHNFEAVFCVGLLTADEDGYRYTVTEFRDIFGDQSLTHSVHIDDAFSDWEVVQITH